MSTVSHHISEQASKAPALECNQLVKGYPGPDGKYSLVIEELTLSAAPGEFLSILGPSGAGKSTLLRCISGLERLDAGSVEIGGQAHKGVAEGTAVVFQDYSKSLFPWLTLQRNVAFGLKGVPRSEAMDRAGMALERVGLGQYLKHYPWQVSGGMQQRTAIARAIARRARFVVFDEPFAAVDALTRITLEDVLLDLWTELDFTAVFVTHDVDEAIYLSDRVVVLAPRPTHVAQEIVVDLPRPRDQVQTRAMPEFQEYRHEALARLGVSAH